MMPRHVHLIACGGTGMGSLAGMFKACGCHVTGSDQAIYPPMSEQLQAWGVHVFEGFDPQHLEPRPDLVIVGNAVRRDNPEAVAAQQAGLPIMSFPQALAHFFIQERHAVVVAGTHGKSTTTALIAWLLCHAGYDPGVFVGAVMRNFDRTFRLGAGPYFVVEGDEYDSAYFDKGPKFLHYRPRTAVLTSLEFDHADIYRDLAHLEAAFARFLQLLPQAGALFACSDFPRVRALLERTPLRATVQTYGLATAADWQVRDVAYDPDGTRFTVCYRGAAVGRFFSPLYGRHNVQNALAAIAVGTHLGLKPPQLAAALAGFQHLKRRGEVRGQAAGVTVIDDFAHHPTAVRATLDAVRQAFPASRVWAVFEPRTATSRRRVFQHDYARALRHADRVLVAEVYRKEQIPESERFSPPQLVQALQASGVPAWFYERTEDIISHLCREARAPDVVVIMSNGGFDNIHQRLLAALARRVAP
ncbi:MAG: UDP-N-acetylmuramate:L-alanyl-gamma-D-glutamyl-meso-diaminopimelate ligase [Candidatus Tectimicrobiota bacterium]|nr:MAG: UDP-N-acetylmuramate:L-alanyl-gamma-D-glutamyl-meso-diaminopimelate ligase [Candidatus Tectomicrobia bacterium]